MLLQSISPRRSTRRPLIILCAVICTVLFGAPFRSTETDAVNVNPTAKAHLPFSRIHSRVQAAVSEKIRFEDEELAQPKARGQQGILALGDDAADGDDDDDEAETHHEMGTHHYRNDGLLEVNPAGPHPIYELVRKAQKDWDKKIRTASKTLEEAVDEYKRRYKRPPPKGFDDWWEYVKAKNVQLPDEYDQIYRDIEPFWGMDPKDLQTLQSEWEDHTDSFTIGKDSYDDVFTLKNYSIPNDDTSRDGLAKGAYEMTEMMDEVAHMLPPFRAVFSPHDNPNLPTDHELREQALQAARSGTFIDIKNPPEVKLDGWISGCSPRSPARNQDINWGGAPNTAPASTRVKSFIYDHRASMDPCLHPSHFLLHGQFISHKRGPIPHRFMVPQFSYGPTMMHHDITPAMPINWIEDILPRSDDPPWDARSDARLQWRGSNTGIWHADDTRWDLAQRARLVGWGGDGAQALGLVDEELSVLMPADEDVRVGRPMRARKAQWAPAMVDIAFAGDQINCAPDMCRRLADIFEYRKRHDIGTAGRYKYYIDVDGNGWSSRFKRLITSNALVFKSTIYPEWYTDRVAPWVHYVPIQVDLSDLWDALVFFRGGPSEKDAHDQMAEKIAEDGRDWSKTFWRMEDMVAYNFRLFLEYSRVMSLERESLSFDPATSERSPSAKERKGEKGEDDEERR